MEACPLVWVQEDTSKSFPKMESFLRKSSFCVKRYLQVMHSFLHNLNFPRTFWNTFILGTFKTLYWERCYCDEPRGRMVQSCANWHGTLATQPNPELLCQANSRVNMKTENLDNYGQNHEGFFFFQDQTFTMQQTESKLLELFIHSPGPFPFQYIEPCLLASQCLVFLHFKSLSTAPAVPNPQQLPSFLSWPCPSQL